MHGELSVKNSYRIAAAVAACLPVSVIHAQSDDLEQVVVTATRVEQPVSEVIGSITVITREEIEQRQAQSVQDLLRGEASVNIVNQGGLGKLSSISLRGANASQTLILVDGVRLGSATAGTTSIEFLPVDQIERVEIVRGPRSSLYGSDAIGGVIQIFTRQPDGFSAHAGYGTHATENYGADFGFRGDALRFGVSGSYSNTDGFDVGANANEPDRDGFRNASASARLGYAFGQVADLELSTLYAHGLTEYDGFYNQTRFTQSAPTATLRVQAGDAVKLTARGGITHDDNEYLNQGIFLERSDTEKRNASIQADWSFAAKHTLTGGADYLQDVIDSITDYVQTSRRNTGVFAQYQGRVGAHELLGSVRQDDNEQFGTHSTGNLGWKWFAIERALALNAGWGNAFRAPTFNDLYYPSDPFFGGGGNPNLKPERSESIELGATGQWNALSWSLQLFQTTAKDLIAFDSNFFPMNISEARLQGAELTLRGQWDAFSASLSYTALDPRSRQSGANYDHILARRARQWGRVDVGYRVAELQIGGSLNVVGARYDDLANTVRLGGYATVDFTADLSLFKNWGLQAKLANAFDREYETARYYNQDGRNLFVSIRYRWQ